MHFSKTKTLSTLIVIAAAATGVKNCTHDQCIHTLPSTGSVDLPPPREGLTISYIALGHGVQNYTCSSQNAAPAAVGAIAVLYDITPLYPGCTSTSLSADDFNELSTDVLWDSKIPLKLAEGIAIGPSSCPSWLDYYVDSANSFLATPSNLVLNGIAAQFLGLYYFDVESSLTFDLVSGANLTGLFFSGAKTAEVQALSDADKGVLATGAVNWLRLDDNGRGLSRETVQVYRVVTAGGAPPACSESGADSPRQTLSVPYTAQYWFYSP